MSTVFEASWDEILAANNKIADCAIALGKQKDEIDRLRAENERLQQALKSIATSEPLLPGDAYLFRNMARRALGQTSVPITEGNGSSNG